MQKRLRVFLLVLLAVWSAAVVAQEPTRGTWSAHLSSISTDQGGNKLVQLEMRTERGHSEMSHTFTLADLRGLTADAIQATHAPVRFQLVRDAGTADFQGEFDQRLGHGEFSFTPNPDYLAALAGLGYPNARDKALALALLDVDRALVSELRQLGYQLSLDELIKARIFRVNREQVEGLRAAGYDHLDFDQLVKLRIFKVDPEYIAQMRALGLRQLSPEELVKLRIFKVDSAQVADLAKAGYTGLSGEDLVTLRIHRVDGAFIERARQAGYDHPRVDELVRMKIMGFRTRRATM